MNNDLALFSDTLKKSGNSLTATRKDIFELLLNKEPQSIKELMKRSRDKFDRSSLYRTIELFESIGIVQRVQLGWKYKLELTDNFNPHHHHLSCLGCGRLIALHEDTSVENLITQLAQANGFKATQHQLEIQGYCSECANNKKH